MECDQRTIEIAGKTLSRDFPPTDNEKEKILYYIRSDLINPYVSFPIQMRQIRVPRR